VPVPITAVQIIFLAVAGDDEAEIVLPLRFVVESAKSLDKTELSHQNTAHVLLQGGTARAAVNECTNSRDTVSTRPAQPSPATRCYFELYFASTR
jgi:hypothetical protein